MENNSTKTPKESAQTATSKKLTCGIIMPIATCDEYPISHWADVKSIIIEAVKETEFEASLVSDDVAIGLIHERIVTNIYNSDIVVCDVSSKNPNVMFELGMRLAFDKPTIIVKDEKTGYTFDAGVIEHLNYPSSLRFADIVKFKIELKNSIENTYKKSKQAGYSSFLKSFGRTIVPAEVGKMEVSETKYIMEQLEQIRREMRFLRRENMGLDEKRQIIKVIRNMMLHGNNESVDLDKVIFELRKNDVDISQDELLNILNNDSRTFTRKTKL